MGRESLWGKDSASVPVPVWLKRVNPLRLLGVTVFKRRFTCVHHTNYLALTRLRLSGGFASHDLNPAITGFASLSGQLFIHARRFILRQGWSSPTRRDDSFIVRPRVATPNPRRGLTRCSRAAACS
jgi:hypothetical protein